MRNRYVLLADFPMIAVATFGAFAVRFDWRFYLERPEFPVFLLAALIVKPAIFFLLGMYKRYWRYASIQELLVIVFAVSAASLAMSGLVVLASVAGVNPYAFSRGVFFSDWMLTLAMVGGMRLGIRVAHESTFPGQRSDSAQHRVLIVGAGAAGVMVVRELRRNPQLGMDPVGFLDDDGAKVGKHIGSLLVLGTTSALPDVVRDHRINHVIIAMPTARGRTVRAILEMCRKVAVKSQTVPGMYELLDGRMSVNRLRNVDISDLLRRNPVDGSGDVAGFITGRVVLITGGGGSIGSELARQIACMAPSLLVLLGHGENSLFEAEAQVSAAVPGVRLQVVVADVRDERRLAMLFTRIRPAIVFHTAAHKHVPLMEENPEEAVTNNIIGTRNVVAQALNTGTERLVLISTDKAVAPSSIMGATKRVAEAIVRQAAQRSGRAFVTVRFGNVLGSRGSVVNTFKQQIERGGPVTVTDPEMKRFFMTIPEAVHLVLQASGQGKGGELFVLEMGHPVKIVDLARDLIRLSGLDEDDIPITFTAVRPGEKLEEVLFDAGTDIVPTSHPDIMQVVGSETPAPTLLDWTISELDDAARRGDRAAIYALLSTLIPGFVRSLDSTNMPVTHVRPHK